MDFLFNNCGLFPEMHGISQKKMNTTLHYRRFWSQQFHLRWDDRPEKQAFLKDVSKRGAMSFAILWSQNLLCSYWQPHGIGLFFAKSFKRKRRGLIFEKKLKNLQTAQEIPPEGILLIASYFNTGPPTNINPQAQTTLYSPSHFLAFNLLLICFWLISWGLYLLSVSNQKLTDSV